MAVECEEPDMAIGGTTPYGYALRARPARIDTVRPIERRKDETEAEPEKAQPEAAPQPPAAKPSRAGQLIDLFV
jgi:hypothetical protein